MKRNSFNITDYKFEGNYFTEEDIVKFQKFSKKLFKLGDVIETSNLDKPFIIDEILVRKIEDTFDVKYIGRPVKLNLEPRAKKFNHKSMNLYMSHHWDCNRKVK
jgi:hypothetical protein